MLQTVLAVLLQLQLAAVAFAAPVAEEIVTTTGKYDWTYGTGGGIIGLIILILDIIVIVEVLQSNRDVPGKLLWCLVVLIFPLVGMVIYFVFSNRVAHKTYTPVP